MRKLLLVLALLFAAVPAFAQVPPPVPALPDTARVFSTSLASSVGPVSVPFAIYGDGSDYGNWLEVWVNNVLQTAVTGWTLTSPTGTLTNIARPITDGQITFTAPQTGTVVIVGARRPRRPSTFAENRGVPARDLNLVLNDIIAQNRETWDKINDVSGRAVIGLPGESLRPLPPAASRANLALCFDNLGNVSTTLCPAASGGGGSTLTVGTTPIVGGTTTRVLFDNAGILGEYTQAQFTAFCNNFTTVLSGCVPASGGGTANFLRADMTWSTPPSVSNIVLGSTTITGGTTTRVLFDNAGTVGEYTATQLTTLCNAFTAVLSGCVPASGGGTTTWLRADGTFTTVPGGNVTIGSTVIASGTTTRVLFDNGGVFGEYTNVQLTALCQTFTAALSGCVASPGAPTGKVLSDNGTWIAAGGTGTVTSVATGTGLTGGTITTSGTVSLASAAANTWKGNATGAGAVPIDNTWTSCSTANSSVQYTNGTGTGCRTTHADLVTADQTLAGGANVTTQILTPGNTTLDCGSRPLQSILNNGAFSITAPTQLDGSCILQVINAVGAGAITALNTTGFSLKTPKGDTFATGATSSATVTFTNATPTTVGWTAHGLNTATMVLFTSSGAMPTGITSGQIYYVCSAGNVANSFQIATTRANATGGTCLGASSTGSGTITGTQPSVFLLSVAVVNGLAFGSWTQEQ